ncbi:MAG TPA: 23S rRNA (uracil(1939)-C(5))-methyltransferase RlmD [Nitrospirota bacterium]|nr:23S rRNA (uracil(1939)-C(5))-methyltransferase RlmD [Nitrospirota bacterium]
MSERTEVLIEKLVYGGSGLARLDNGQAVFVPGVLPGERAAVEIKKRKKGFLQAELIEIISPSTDRRAPPCIGEKQCTGATWPHISYPAQLRYKQEILQDTLKRIGGMEPARLLPILPSPRNDHYRLRTQFNVRMKDGLQRIGFFRQGSYDLIEVEQAFLIHPLIDKVLKGMRSLSNELPLLTEIHINASPAGEAHVLLFSEQGPLPPMKTFFAKLRSVVPEIIGLTGFVNRKKVFSLGRNQLSLEVEGLALRATEGNFFQVNWEQNRNMVRTVLDFAECTGNETVLDLYCGIGNFSLPLATKAKAVIGIESGYSAIEDAVANAKLNNIANAEFIADDLQKGLKTLIQKKMRADVIVLDPPRSGATLKTLERVLAFVPRKIIYVSCNPSTLARDLKFFHLFGFRLDRLQPVDMFPYTYHIECVAEMVREG